MRRFNSGIELEECFSELIISHSEELGLAPNEILFDSLKAQAPYLCVEFADSSNEMISTGIANFHKMNIQIMITIPYKKGIISRHVARKKAAIIERICKENSFTYSGHIGFKHDKIEVSKQADYTLFAECFAYYRNV